MAFLNKHQIATYEDLKSKIIQVWGGDIKIRVLNVAELQEYNEYIKDNQDNDKGCYYFLIKKCCLGEDDKRIFEDCDDNILDNKSLESVTYIVNEILSLNKQLPNDVEELAKNS